MSSLILSAGQAAGKDGRPAAPELITRGDIRLIGLALLQLLHRRRGLAEAVHEKAADRWSVKAEETVG